MTITAAIDTHAKTLAYNLRTNYTHGLELTLAGALIDTLNDQQRDAALNELVHDKFGRLIHVTCLLDDETAASYALVDQMAKTLLDAIRKQDMQAHALEELVTGEIANRATLINRKRTRADR